MNIIENHSKFNQHWININENHWTSLKTIENPIKFNEHSITTNERQYQTSGSERGGGGATPHGVFNKMLINTNALFTQNT